MKKAKKIILSATAVLIAAVICFGGYLGYRLYFNKPETINSYDEIYSREPVSLEVAEDGTFRVLKINDTHFFDGVCEDDRKTLDNLKVILDKTPCDLIIADGDLVDGFNLKPSYDKYQAISLFAQLIESYDIPWTFAPGNNDGEIDGENEDVIAYMLQYDNFIGGNDENVDGSMQFFIDLKSGERLVHSIAVMDSGARKIKAIGSYDFIKENQIEWLLNGINERKVGTSVFFHMATPAFQSAYYNGSHYDGFYASDYYPLDEIEENRLFDDMTADNEYISLISTGHIHSDNMCSFYNNRYYQLSSVSGYSASHQDFITPSCTLTVIDTNAADNQAMYKFEQIQA